MRMQESRSIDNVLKTAFIWGMIKVLDYKIIEKILILLEKEICLIIFCF